MFSTAPRPAPPADATVTPRRSTAPSTVKLTAPMGLGGVGGDGVNNATRNDIDVKLSVV